MLCAALVLLDVVGSGCGALRCGVRAVLSLHTLSLSVDASQTKMRPRFGNAAKRSRLN